jgi:uncharacterized membrane protein
MGMIEILLITCTVGSGVIAGLFFIFSVCVMKALKQQEPQCGASAMQAINDVILNPSFFLAFMGTPLACLALIIFGLLSESPYPLVFGYIGAAVYLIGSFGVTVVRNVPMNDKLKAVNVNDADALQYWDVYLTEWTFWNHIRFWASVIPTALFSYNLTLIP